MLAVTKRVIYAVKICPQGTNQRTVRRCGLEGLYRWIASAVKSGFVMWNVFVIDNGECQRLNSQPYDIEQIAELLDQLAELDEPVDTLMLTRDPSVSATY